jgi:hypothetical protein
MEYRYFKKMYQALKPQGTGNLCGTRRSKRSMIEGFTVENLQDHQEKRNVPCYKALVILIKISFK